MGTILSLAWRNLWRNSRRTAITVSSIALGLALSVLFFGLNDGGHSQMIRNGIAMGEGHLTIQPLGYLEAPANHRFLHDGRAVMTVLEASGIQGRVAPRIELQVLATTAANAVGVGLLGIDGERDPHVASVRPALIEGSWLERDDRRGLVVGARMAKKLKARVGSKIVFMSGTATGDVEAQLGRVRGIFRTGIDELDGFVAFSSLDFARRFLLAEGGEEAREPITRVAIFLAEPESTFAWRARLGNGALPPEAAALTWEELMPQLLVFILLDDAGTFVWVAIIFVLVTFGILNTILMSVLERTREFGLLRALGMGSGRLLVLVLTETLILSLVSLGLGWLIGGGAHAYFAAYGLDLSALYPQGVQASGFYMDPVLYSELRPDRVIFLTLLALVATLASGIYPAIRAARVAPVVALQT